MKNLILFLLFFPILSFSQIGIGTENPTRTLDVNGDLRVRATASTVRESAAKDSIITVGATGNVTRVSSKTVIESHFKTYIKGSFITTGPSLINLGILANGYSVIPFNTTEFDIDSEFNITTNTFTAKRSGIYSFYIAIKVNSAVLSVNGDFGVAIFQGNTLKARNSFANLQLLGLNITPSVRSAQTILQLNTGDTVTFRTFSSVALTAGLLSNGDESFFTIQQVR